MKSHLRTDSATLRKKPGPLQSHIHSFATLLANRGYSRKSIVERIRVAQSLTAFDRRKLKCSRFSANDFEGFASTAANTPRPLTPVEYLGRHRAQLGLGRCNS